MIFKQLPTAISDLNKLGIALKSLDAMKLGTVGVNLGNVEAYRTALKGLSVEQSVFALASKGATEEQIRQILVTDQAKLKDVEAAMAKAGLTTATKALNAEELIALATKKGISAERAKEIASALGLIATEEGQIISKKQLTVATLQQAGATDAEITAMLGLNAVETTNIGITNVLTASFTKLWAVITAHPIGAIITAIGAVAVGTIAYINKVNKDAEKALVEAHENAEKALEDTKTSLSDDKSELQSVNSELETTKEKIKEISSIGAPTLTEQNELNKLSTANAQLEAQKTLLENNIKLKQKSSALDAKELLGTQVEMEYSSILDNSSITSKKESYTYADHAKYQASNLKNAYNIYMKALEEGNVKRQELAQELIDASAGDTAELTSELLEIVESFKYDDGTIIDGYEDIYNEYMGMIYNLQSLTNPDTFLEIAKSVTTGKGIDYEKAISEAYTLAYEGNFDVDNLNQDFVKALADAGIDESTIDYIFSIKQKEYQLLVDKINNKYKVSEVPDKIKQDYWDANGNIHFEYVDVDEETKNRIEEINTINQSLNDYAKENPVEFQLVTSYDENFSTLDKYIEEEKSKIQSVQNELQSLSEQGNVDLTIRPVIDSSAMKEAGWDVEDGSIATTFTQGEFIWQGGEDDGQYVYVHYTPILPDGTVLTPDQLSNYLYGTLESSKNILEADDKGIVLKVDTDLQGVSAEDIKQLQEKGIQTDGMQSFLNSMGQWDDSVHTVQESYYDMSGTVDYVDNAIKRLVEDAKKTEGIDTDETDIQFSDIFALKDSEGKLNELGKINEEIDKFQSAYKGLKEAMDSYNDTGTFTLDQVQEIISYGGDYLKYLMDENGNLQLNEEALNKVAIARINEMRAKALSNLMDNLDKITNEEQALNYLETQLLNTATAYDDLTASRIKAWSEKALENGISQGTINKVTKSFENQVSAINEMFNNISLDSIYKSSSSSAKSAAKDAWKEAFQVEYDTLKHNLEMEYITEEQYYNSLNALNQKYFAGKSEYLDKYRQYEEEVYKGLKNIYKDYVDSYLSYMKQSLESNRIDYKTYSRDVAKLLKDMYAQGKIAAKDYHDYTKEMLEVQKDIYDKALSAITGLLDDEINKIEDAIDAVEKQNDALEKQKTLMENAASAVSDYYQKLVDGIEDTNDALDEQNEKLEGQLSDMDDVISAVVKYYDSLIDADQKAIDNLGERNDLIKEQIEKYDSLISVADRLYEEEQENLKSEQDAIQDKIDLLQEENDQKDLQYRKEEALYELQRSQQQRTKKLYVGDKGYIYDTDKKAIRDAQKNLQDIETEELVSSLEKEKEALQDSIDSLQEYRDALSEISDAYQKLVDERNAAELLGEGYKNLILETNIDDWLELKDKYIQANDEIADNEDLIKSHEDKIKIWEEEKEQWSSLPQSIIDETNKQKATEKFGADWEKQINEGRFNAFDSFKKNYLDIQSKINDNTETINSNNEKIEQYNKLKEEWDSLTNSLDENTKSQAAIQMFGADWEKQLNDGRLISYDAFKNQYLSIESQINDNTLLIDSYNEKIEYYENLKNQWNSVTSAYEDEMNKQYAAQIIGANWESDVLNGRLGTLDNFKNQYISIQQAIADAAWDSANEQIKAAQAAADSANEQIKSAQSASDAIPKTDSSSGGNHGYKAYIGNELIGVYNSKNEANDAAQKEVSNRAESEARKAAEKNGGKDATSIYNNTKMGVGSNLTKKIKIEPYASGTNNAKKGLNLVGEDGIETFIDNEGNISLVTEPTLIPMEGGEIVKNEKETKSLLDSMNLVPIQTGDIWKKFATNMPDLSSMINVNVPDYSKISGMFSKAQTIEQHNQFNVTLPNITDSTKATKLFEELQRLPLDALQYANTRKK